MKITCHPLSSDPPSLRAAPSKRDWMDATPDSYAYRCLPLTIANAHGWEVLNPVGFSAFWAGQTGKDAIAITLDDPEGAPIAAHVRAISHFGSGVLTFELPFLLKTSPGWNLMVSGPINRPKDAIAPLTGVIETDWSPYTFTMNWLFTREKTHVRFEAGEPIAHLLPVRRGQLEKVETEVRLIHDDADRMAQNDLWRQSRSGFLKGLSEKDAAAVAEKWQKAYYRGERPDGAPGVKDHAIKLRLSEFAPQGRAQEMFAGEGVKMKRKG
ncbi:MAG: DUF6065 family protein [Maricaulaceae bacterium]|jgi:hypothetical protein